MATFDTWFMTLPEISLSKLESGVLKRVISTHLS